MMDGQLVMRGPAGYGEESSPVGPPAQLLVADEPPSISLKLIEVLVYIPILVGVFFAQLGLFDIPKAGGGINLVCTVFIFAIVLFRGERLPLSVWFVIVLNISANVSQVIGQQQYPITGQGLPPLLFWTGSLLGTCCLVRNSAAEKRLVIFMVALMVVVALLGGRYQRTHGTERLAFVDVGGGMGNPNTIAYITGLFSAYLFFWSLRSARTVRPVLWTLGLITFVMLVHTLSRTGITLFFVGVFFLIMSIMAGRGMRLGGVVLIAFAVLVLSQFAYLLADQVVYLQRRLELRTAEGRLGIYSIETVYDLFETLMFGLGPDNAIMTATGITAHNTFIYLHRAFGGITAWPYLVWMLILSVRVFRMFRSHDLPVDIRMQVMAFFLMMLGGEMTNNINTWCFSSVFATALVEKYASPYSRRRLAERRWALQGYGPVPAYAG